MIRPKQRLNEELTPEIIVKDMLNLKRKHPIRFYELTDDWKDTLPDLLTQTQRKSEPAVVDWIQSQIQKDRETIKKLHSDITRAASGIREKKEPEEATTAEVVNQGTDYTIYKIKTREELQPFRFTGIPSVKFFSENNQTVYVVSAQAKAYLVTVDEDQNIQVYDEQGKKSNMSVIGSYVGANGKKFLKSDKDPQLKEYKVWFTISAKNMTDARKKIAAVLDNAPENVTYKVEQIQLGGEK